MKLEKHLKHQDDSVFSIVKSLENVNIKKTNNLYQNPLIDLDSETLIENIKNIQENNGIPQDYRRNIGITEENNGFQYLNIDIKMETGTGKTFVQLKTIYELNALYGFNKFIIVVPTLPIKAGTKQFIQSKDTKIFFNDEYSGVEVDLREVKSVAKRKGREYFPSVVREYATASSLNKKRIQVMLINAQLITNGTMLTKEYDTTILDDLTNPSLAIKETKPIIIIDEPHKFKKNNTTYKKIIERLGPQCIIRFGATFPEKKVGREYVKDYQNLVYDLNSVKAFNENLVKGVIPECVPTISGKDLRIKLLDTKNRQKAVIQKIDGTHKKSYELEKNDSLSIVHEDFNGIEVAGVTKNSMILSNGVEIIKGMELNPESYSTSYQEMMLETAIKRHFEIEEDNFKNNIKTLALFFIDDISAYRKQDESKPTYILDFFEKILKEQLREKIDTTNDKNYKEYLKISLENVSKCHGGYFSQDNAEKDEDIIEQVDEILNDKEKLLKIKNSNGKYNLRRFIFSKWTLKEGWDNPNVFTICKLRSSGSETSKLQEVGRGLRLPVDSNLNRISNRQFYLNYIVDFTEKNFAKELINEINMENNISNKISIEDLKNVAKERNVDFNQLFIELLINNAIDAEYNIKNQALLNELCPEIKVGLDNNKIIERTNSKTTTKIRKDNYKKIKNLWELLNQKYIINYQKFKDEEIENALINILREGIITNDQVLTQRNLLVTKDGSASVEEVEGLSLATNKKLNYNEFLIKLSNSTNIPILNIHNALVKYSKEKELNNDFFNSTVLERFIIRIKNWKIDELYKRFTYKKTNLPIHPTSLTEKNGELKDVIVLGNIGTNSISSTPQEKYLYEAIAFDSPLEKKNIMEQIDNVIVFGKIPKNSIKIPIADGSTYSPDFMYLVDKKDGTSELNLIVESKDVNSERDLRPEELYKIECAKKFFEEIKNEEINIKFREQFKRDDIVNFINEL